jgi:hypothetical protein
MEINRRSPEKIREKAQERGRYGLNSRPHFSKKSGVLSFMQANLGKGNAGNF